MLFLGTSVNILEKLLNFHLDASKPDLEKRGEKNKEKKRPRKKRLCWKCQQHPVAQDYYLEYLRLNISSEIGPLPLQPPKKRPQTAPLGLYRYSGPTFWGFQKLLWVCVLGDGQAELLVLSINNRVQKRLRFPGEIFSFGLTIYLLVICWNKYNFSYFNYTIS